MSDDAESGSRSSTSRSARSSTRCRPSTRRSTSSSRRRTGSSRSARSPTSASGSCSASCSSSNDVPEYDGTETWIEALLRDPTHQEAVVRGAARRRRGGRRRPALRRRGADRARTTRPATASASSPANSSANADPRSGRRRTAPTGRGCPGLAAITVRRRFALRPARDAPRVRLGERRRDRPARLARPRARGAIHISPAGGTSGRDDDRRLRRRAARPRGRGLRLSRRRLGRAGDVLDGERRYDGR